MANRFIAFVDEAGDEGFVFRRHPEKGSSEWWNISAAIFSHEALDELAACEAAYKAATGRHKPFHFADERHENRVGFIQTLAEVNFHFISVIAHKHTLADAAAIPKKKHHLFYYTAKLLLERITWYADQMYGDPDAKVEVVFSNRGQLKREDLDKYLDRLRGRTAEEDAFGLAHRNHDIHWPRLSAELIDIRPHESHIGLQAADAVASSVRAALELTDHGYTEHRYVKLLQPRVWRRNGKTASYGIKFVETELRPNAAVRQNRFHWLRRFGCPPPIRKAPLTNRPLPGS